MGAQLDGKATSVSDAITFKKKYKIVIPIRESMRFKFPIDDPHPPYFPTNTCSPSKNSLALLTKKLYSILCIVPYFSTRKYVQRYRGRTWRP